jgi:hypothetical protein
MAEWLFDGQSKENRVEIQFSNTVRHIQDLPVNIEHMT